MHLPTDAVLNMADPHVSGLNEHDGIERNVLLVMFLIIAPVGLLLYDSKLFPRLMMVLGAALWLVFLVELHFFTNLVHGIFSSEKIGTWIEIITGFTIIAAVWTLVYRWNTFWGRAIIAETIIACCFVPFGDISIYDYSYIMAPALKVLQSGTISSAYFQYDILPSIPAMFIIKNGGNAYTYRIVAQVSMFVFFVGVFAIARRFFVYKNLAFILLASMLLMRLFMGLNEVTNAAQVTSLRLDWWLLLFAVAYFSGLSNYKVGICLLLLIVLLNSFGIIYMLCYLLLIGFLLLFQLYTNYMNDGALPNAQNFTDWFKTYAVNTGLALTGLFLHRLITGHWVNESVSIYKDFQLGMLPVLQDSLYWYFAAVFVFCFTLLLVFKGRFTESYWKASLLMLFLFIGNSIYFYGRSHENNIINISGTLLFVVVLCSDVLLQILSGAGIKIGLKQKFAALTPFAFIFLVLMVADANVFAFNIKTYKQYVKSGLPAYSSSFPSPLDMQVIADVTHNSRKVYFMIYGGSDYLLYNAGHYDIPCKFVPIDTWMLKSEKIDYANKLLEQGYYIVAVQGDDIFKKELLPYLHYKHTYPENVYVAYSND